ncbi:MAG: glycosyltransferase 87 family protein [Gaiellales bacterium]
MSFPHPASTSALTGRGGAGQRVRVLLAVLVVFGMTIALAATLKADCFGHDGSFWRSRPCYNDIEPLYTLRGIDRGVFPYIHARLDGSVGSNGFNEYPVATGLFMWAVGLPVGSAGAYLTLTMVLLGACALATTVLLARMAGARSLYWAAAPPLVLFAFHNWDLLAVTAATAGLVAWRARRPNAAAALFGLGAAFKLYPALFIAPLVLERVARRQWRGALLTFVAGAGTILAVNLPFVAVNPAGWWATYRFHEQRGPDTSGTIWAALFPHLSTGTENAASALATGLALCVICAAFLGWRGGPPYPVVECCAAMTAAVIVLGKVSSPQFVLWVLPFFALARAWPGWWAMLSITALARYGGLFGVGILGFGMHTGDAIVRAAVVAQALGLTLFAAQMTLAMIGSAAEPASLSAST